MERGFLWIVLVIQFTMTLASNSSATVANVTNVANPLKLPSSTPTSPQSLSAISPESSSSSSVTPNPLNSRSTPLDDGGSSFNSASSAASSNSTIQQTTTVPSHSTTTPTSPVNTTQGAMISSSAAIQTQSMSTYSHSLPWSRSPSFICTSWSVKQGGCAETCSNMGGTVTETCQCISNSVPIEERSVCEIYSINTTRTGKCKEACPTSGINALESLSWIVAVQCSLAMFILFT